MRFRTMLMVILMVVFAVETNVYGDQLQPPAAKVMAISVNGVLQPYAEGENVHIINGRTYVSLKYLSRALNVDAGWHGGRKVAFVGTEPDWTLVDQDPVANEDPLPIRFYFNGTKTGLPTGQLIFIEGPVPYVPIRFIAEKLGNEVVWSQENDRGFVHITSKN